MSTLARSCVVLAVLAGTIPAQTPAAPESRPSDTAEALVRSLYAEISFEAGAALPDWKKVRGMFLEEAVIVLRTSRSASTVFSVDGFVGDFVKFIERAEAKKTGFTERILNLKSTEFRDIAQVWVVYEAHIPGSPRPPQRGLDSFNLVRREGGWQIASVVNEIPDRDNPIPEELRK
jgi:hypothetical protein